MIINYEGILAIEGRWLISAGIMSKRQFNYYTVDKPLMNVVRRGCVGNPVLVSYNSIPPKFQKTIKSKLGYDPAMGSSAIVFKDYMVRDTEAEKYYRDYVKPDGTHLTEDKIQEYVANATALNAVGEFLDRFNSRRATGRATRDENGKPINVWQRFANAIAALENWPCNLPKKGRTLQRKINKYKDEGYEALIHGGMCNDNTEKINGKARKWLIARFADRVNRVADIRQLWEEYNQRAALKQWKPLKDERAIQNFLQRPEIKVQWFGHRYGALKAKEKYTYHHTTKLPTMRDSLWYGDGTKLNLYYQDKNGKIATAKVYEVMDAYSEVFLGCHISHTEDYEAQFMAYKMAAKTAGRRPYQISMDNQGGHKKLESSSFLAHLGRLAINTQPYNGKSKTIENAFYRFQKQVMNKLWFFTGQNIQAKELESKVNMEHILANAESLPTFEELKKIYYSCREEWNHAPFRRSPKNPDESMPRVARYNASVNPETPELTPLEMVSLFWIERKKPLTYGPGGLSFIEKGVEYQYVVYDSAGGVDMDFHHTHIDHRFYVRFDPDDMSLIYLYEDTPQGKRFVTAAETKITVARGRQEITEFEDRFVKDIQAKNKQLQVDMRDHTDKLLQEYGARAEDYGLVSPALKGIENRRRRKPKKRKSPPQDIAEVLKTESNSDPTDYYNAY